MILNFHERFGISLCSRHVDQSKHYVLISTGWTLHSGSSANGRSTKLSLDHNFQRVFNSDSVPDYLTFQKSWEKRNIEVTLKIGPNFSSYEVVSVLLKKNPRRQSEICNYELDEAMATFPALRELGLMIDPAQTPASSSF